MSLMEGRTGKWEVVLGLEVHAQVVSRAKLFSGAATLFGAEPNTQVSFVDAAMPGMLPVINGYWEQDSQGWRWVSGGWARLARSPAITRRWSRACRSCSLPGASTWTCRRFPA